MKFSKRQEGINELMDGCGDVFNITAPTKEVTINLGGITQQLVIEEYDGSTGHRTTNYASLDTTNLNGLRGLNEGISRLNNQPEGRISIYLKRRIQSVQT